VTTEYITIHNAKFINSRMSIVDELHPKTSEPAASNMNSKNNQWKQ
jgi:hypothetical protein